MKKLKLNLDEIKVESFITNSRSKNENGTIFGNATINCTHPIFSPSCGVYNTCQAYCEQQTVGGADTYHLTCETDLTGCDSLPAIVCCPNSAGMECSCYCPPTGVEITCPVTGAECP